MRITKSILRQSRLDWRDPNMPVYRNYSMPDGSQKEWAEPEYERRYRKRCLEMSFGPPDWRQDPTYDMKRKK